MKKGKSLNALMKHIREIHNVDIKGSLDKNSLMNMGYYHGYKRYRFIKNRSNIQNIESFSQIKAIHDFDFELKGIFYSMITLVETGMKNRTIDAIVTSQNPDIESIYKSKLTEYLDYDKDSLDTKKTKKFKEKLKKRLEFHSEMERTIGYNYGKNVALSHFVHKGNDIPLWVFFEIITFGQFGYFISSLSESWRIEVSKVNGLQNASFNQNGRMMESIIFTLTDLRNATMHNSVVFDANFNRDGIAKGLKNFLMTEIDVDGITFDTIIDYLILLVFILKKQGYSKRELNNYVKEFVTAKEKLFRDVPLSTYGQLLGMDSKKKIVAIKKFISQN